MVYGDQGAEEDSNKLALTDKLLDAVLAEAQVVCGVSLSLSLGLSLVGSLTWRLLSLLAGSSWRKVLALGVTLWWFALMSWLLLLPVGSRIGGSPRPFPSWLNFLSNGGMRRFLVPLLSVRYGPLVRLIRLTGILLRFLGLFRMPGRFVVRSCWECLRACFFV